MSSSFKSSRGRYPLFYAFGQGHEYLSEGDSVGASVDDRIKSVWPFIVNQVLSFSRTLKPRELVNFDPEDTATEIYVALRDNDSEWVPERGKYITFAGVIISRELCAIRDKARTVESPSNSSCRMKEYNEEESAGTITERRRKTADDIRRSIDGIKSMSGSRAECDREHHEDAESIATFQESNEEVLDAIKQAVRNCLNIVEASVLGRLTGLWGQRPMGPWMLSCVLGIPEAEVRSIQARARRKVRKYLTDIGHPIVTTEFA